jgi:hypothetical protein
MYPLEHTVEGHKAKAHETWRAPDIQSKAYQPMTTEEHAAAFLCEEEEPLEAYEASYHP